MAVIYDGEFPKDFRRELEKKRKLNPVGENVYLLPDGTVEKDEDAIIAVQRQWKERKYSPGGSLYNKVRDRWYARLATWE